MSSSNDERESIAVNLPDDVASVFARYPEYRKAYEALTAEQKHDLIRWIESASDPEHRRQRLDTTIRSLR